MCSRCFLICNRYHIPQIIEFPRHFGPSNLSQLIPISNDYFSKRGYRTHLCIYYSFLLNDTIDHFHNILENRKKNRGKSSRLEITILASRTSGLKMAMQMSMLLWFVQNPHSSYMEIMLMETAENDNLQDSYRYMYFDPRTQLAPELI